MGFWEEIGQGVKAGILTAIEINKGESLVRQWVNFKMHRAQQQIDIVVAEAVPQNNKQLLIAILDEFGDQIKFAETQEFQEEVCELLWYFKERVGDQIAKSSRAIAGG